MFSFQNEVLQKMLCIYMGKKIQNWTFKICLLPSSGNVSICTFDGTIFNLVVTDEILSQAEDDNQGSKVPKLGYISTSNPRDFLINKLPLKHFRLFFTQLKKKNKKGVP